MKGANFCVFLFPRVITYLWQDDSNEYSQPILVSYGNYSYSDTGLVHILT